MENYQGNIDQVIDNKVKELSLLTGSLKNYRNQEVVALKAEITELKQNLEMKEKIIKVRDDSLKILRARSMQQDQKQQHFEIDTKAKEHQLKRLRISEQKSDRNYNLLKMHTRNANQNWSKRELMYTSDIAKLYKYIECLHSTLEQNGIPCQFEFNSSSDETLVDYESDDSEYKFDCNAYIEHGHLDSDTEIDDDEIETEKEIKSAEFFKTDHRSNENPQSTVGESSNASNHGAVIDKPTQTDELDLVDDWNDDECEEDLSERNIGIQCVELDQMECRNGNDQVSLESVAVCQSFNSKSDNQTQSVELIHDDRFKHEVASEIDGNNPQQAACKSDGDIENGCEPRVELKVAQKIKLDPFIHGYVEKKVKKQQRKKPKKPKSKTKFTNIMTIGSY